MAIKNIIKSALWAVLAAATATGCDGILGQEPINALNDKVIFQDAARAESALISAYDGVQDNRYYAGRVQLYGDIMSDAFTNVTNNGSTALSVYRFTGVSNSSEVEGVWTAAYQAIGRANIVIDGLKNSTGVPTAKSTQFTAEARFLRALSYFTLMTFYTKPYNLAADVNTELGVIIYTEPQTSVPQPKPRSSIKACYDLILADLDFAVTNLPLTHGTASASAQRATVDAARALRMRVNMSMNRWDDVIADGQVLAPVGLVTPGGRKLASIVTLPTFNDETLLSIPHAATDNPNTQNHLPGFFNPATVTGGSGDYKVAAGLLADARWLAADARRTTLLSTVGGNVWLVKYPSANPPINWAPVLRYPEVLLNYAEAMARKSGTVDATALTLLNAVRRRGVGAGLDYVADDFATQDDFYSAILIEKKIEHLGEGLQIYDIRRLGLSYVAKPDPIGGNTPLVAPSDVRYIWPIANSEITRNAACQQNPQ